MPTTYFFLPRIISWLLNHLHQNQKHHRLYLSLAHHKHRLLALALVVVKNQ